MQCHWWDWFLCPWIVLAPLFYLNCFLVCSLYVCIWVFLLLCSRRGRWCSSPVFEKYSWSLLHWMPYFIVLSNNSYTSPTLLHNFVLWKCMHASYMSSVPLFYWLFSFACSRVCLLLVGWMIQMVIQFWFALVMTILFTYMSCHRECLNLSLNQFGWSLFLPMLLFNEIELLCARFMERGRIFSRREVRVIEIGPDGLFFTGDGTGMLSVWKILAKPNAEMSWIIYVLLKLCDWHVI